MSARDPDGSVIHANYDESDSSDSSGSEDDRCGVSAAAAEGGVSSAEGGRLAVRRQPSKPAPTRTTQPSKRAPTRTTPRGLTVRRRKSPGSGSISGMTTPTPKSKKKKTSKSKKTQKEEDTVSLIKTTRSKPASQYDEAKLDKAYCLRHNIKSADDSDDEWDWDDPDWQQALEEHEEILSILKWESISVEPEYVESDPSGLTNKVIEGAPEGWKPHGPPPDWKPRNLKPGEDPPFHKVDNPGKWPVYIYRQAYKNAQSRTGYRYHALPTPNTNNNKKTTTYEINESQPHMYDRNNDANQLPRQSSWSYLARSMGTPHNKMIARP